jgi:hypothetical protein
MDGTVCVETADGVGRCAVPSLDAAPACPAADGGAADLNDGAVDAPADAPP